MKSSYSGQDLAKSDEASHFPESEAAGVEIQFQNGKSESESDDDSDDEYNEAEQVSMLETFFVVINISKSICSWKAFSS
jgi:hypothetical protein